MSVEDQLGAKFQCPKCKNSGGETSRFAATGTGLSRFFDVQHKRFITVSCRNCGFTEMYNPKILERSGKVGDVLDFIFGG